MGLFDLLNNIRHSNSGSTSTLKIELKSDEEVFQTLGNMGSLPCIDNIDYFTRFVSQYGLRTTAALISLIVLKLCIEMSDNNIKITRRTFVYTLRWELDGLNVATSGAKPGSVGSAVPLARKTLDELFTLYQAAGAMDEKNCYSEEPVHFLNSLFMILYLDKRWSSDYYQVKLRCLVMHYLNILYYNVFTPTPIIDQDIIFKATEFAFSQDTLDKVKRFLSIS